MYVGGDAKQAIEFAWPKGFQLAYAACKIHTKIG